MGFYQVAHFPSFFQAKKKEKKMGRKEKRERKEKCPKMRSHVNEMLNDPRMKKKINENDINMQ